MANKYTSWASKQSATGGGNKYVGWARSARTNRKDSDDRWIWGEDEERHITPEQDQSEIEKSLQQVLEARQRDEAEKESERKRIQDEVIAQFTGDELAPAPEKPKYGSIWERFGDTFEANSPQDKFERESQGQPTLYQDQKKMEKEREEKGKSFDLTKEEIDLRKEFFSRQDFNIERYAKTKDNQEYRMVHEAVGPGGKSIKDIDLARLAEQAEKDGLFKDNPEAQKLLEEAREADRQGKKWARNNYAGAIALVTPELEKGLHDKVEGMFQTRIKQVTGGSGTGSIPEQLARNTKAGFINTFANLPSNLQSLGSNALDVVAPEGSRLDNYAEERFQDSVKDVDDMRQHLEDYGLGPQYGDNYASILGQGIGSLLGAALIGPGAGGKAITGFWNSIKAFAKPSVVGTLFGINQAGDIVRDSIQEGQGNLAALIQSGVAGYAEGVLENFGLTKMVERFGTGRMVSLVRGVLTEGSQEFLQDISSSAVMSTYKDVDWKEALGQALVSFSVGGILGGGVGLAGGRLSTNLQEQGVSKEDADYIESEYNKHLKEKAEIAVKKLEEIEQIDKPKSVMDVKPTPSGPSTVPGANIQMPSQVASHTTRASNLDSILATGLEPRTPMQLDEQGNPTDQPLPGYEGQKAVYFEKGSKDTYKFAGEDNIKIIMEEGKLPNNITNGDEIAVSENLMPTPENVYMIEAPNQIIADKLQDLGYNVRVNENLAAESRLAEEQDVKPKTPKPKEVVNPPNVEETESAKDWEENYADKYGQLEGEATDLQNQIKAAKKAEKAGLQKKLESVNKQLIEMEQEFTKKWKKDANEEGAEERVVVKGKPKKLGKNHKAIIEAAFSKFVKSYEELGNAPGPHQAMHHSEIISWIEEQGFDYKQARDMALEVNQKLIDYTELNSEKPKSTVKSQKQEKGKIKKTTTRADFEIKYPKKVDQMPKDMQEKVEQVKEDVKGGKQDEVTLKQARRLSSAEAAQLKFTRSEIATILKLAPGMAENTVATISKEDGTTWLNYKSEQTEGKINLNVMGISNDRIAEMGLTDGKTIDLKNVLTDKGNLAVIRNTETGVEGMADNAEAFKQRPELPKRQVEESPLEEQPITKEEAAQLEGLNKGIEILSEAFDIPIRRGRMRMRRALGEHHNKEEIIRLRKVIGEGAEGGRFGVAAHEIGHNMHKNIPEFKIIKGKGLSILDKAGNKQLSSIATDPGAKGSVYYEGFAEFMRYYVVNPEALVEKMPDVYKTIDDVLEGYPGMKTALLRARSLWHTYQEMPAVKKVMSQISYSDEKSTVAKRVKEGIPQLYKNWVNDLYPLERLENQAIKEGAVVDYTERASTRAFLHRGAYGKAKVFLEYGTINTDPFVMNEKTKTWGVETTGKGFKEITQPIYNVGQEAEFDAYLVAKRMVSLKDQKNMTAGVAYQDALKAVEQAENKYPHFAEVQQELVAYNDRVVDYVIESGMIDVETATRFRELNANYVPFFKVYEAAGAKGLFGKGFTNLSSGIKRMKGSESQIISPLESIVKNTMTLIQAADANLTGLKLAEMAENSKFVAREFERVKTPQSKVATITLSELGIEEALKKVASFEGMSITDDADVNEAIDIFRPMFQDKSERIVTVMKDGKRQFYYVEDPAVYQALTNINAEQAGELAKILTLPASLLRAGATLTPEFIGRNPMRDQFSAFIFSKTDYIPFVDLVRGGNNVVKKDNAYWTWQAAGGPYATLVSVDRNYDNKELNALTAGTFETRYNNPNQRKALLKEKLNIIKYLRDASEFMENATRMGEFREAIGTHRNLGIKRNAMHPLEAAMASKEVTLNFSRRGTYGRIVNSMSAFFNAGVQDIDKTAREIKTRPANYFFKGSLLITLPTILLYLANRDEEWYQELPEWRKDFAWNIRIGGKIVSIPRPFLAGVIFGAMPERIMGEFDNKGSRDLSGLPQLIGSVIPNPLPTLTRPIIETITNYNFFTGLPIDPVSEQRLDKGLRYGPWTSNVAKVVSDITGNIVSPRHIDNMIGGFFGGLGDYAVSTVEIALKMAGYKGVYDNREAAETMTDWPFFRAFIAREPYGSGSQSVNSFYSAKARADSASASANELEKLFGKEAADKYREDHPEYAFASTYSKFAGYISDIRSSIDSIRLDDSKSPEQKRDEIAVLNKRMTYIAQQALFFDPGKENSRAPLPSRAQTSDYINTIILDDIGKAREVVSQHNEAVEKFLADMGDFFSEEERKKIREDRRINLTSSSISTRRKNALEKRRSGE